MLFTGLGMVVGMASSNTVLQTIVADDKRGRVMSFNAMAFMGMTPFGSLMSGGLVSQIGAPKAVLLGGICSIIGSILFARRLSSLRQVVRSIYIKKGIILEVAQGIQTATELTVPPKE